MSTTIRIGEDTKQAINDLGNTFDSADDVLQRLIHEAGYSHLLSEEEETSRAEEDENETVDSEEPTEPESKPVDEKVPSTFQQFVTTWDWPDRIKSGSDQAKNVSGVVWRMMAQESYNKEAYNWAIEHRAEKAREEDPSRGDKYEWTVRDSCVRGLGFSGSGATKKFRDEAKRLVKEYKGEYRWEVSPIK